MLSLHVSFSCDSQSVVSHSLVDPAVEKLKHIPSAVCALGEEDELYDRVILLSRP